MYSIVCKLISLPTVRLDLPTSKFGNQNFVFKGRNRKCRRISSEIATNSTFYFRNQVKLAELRFKKVMAHRNRQCVCHVREDPAPADKAQLSSNCHLNLSLARPSIDPSAFFLPGLLHS